jgi:hypothetical protein
MKVYLSSSRCLYVCVFNIFIIAEKNQNKAVIWMNPGT